MLPVLLLLLLSAASFQDNMENRPLDGKAFHRLPLIRGRGPVSGEAAGGRRLRRSSPQPLGPAPPGESQSEIQTGSVSSLDPDLENGVPEIKMNVSVITVRRVLPPSKSREKRELNINSIPHSKLPWKQWHGSLPSGAVYIYNSYDHRIDYICKVGCYSGFYSPSKGSYCRYPKNQKEYASYSFELLVNEDWFWIFVWEEGSYGSVPKNSVRTCSSEDIYVGKNEYGLGMVYPKDRCFYLPWEGSEYWYQKSYEVLTTMKVEEEIISDFKYFIDKATIFKGPQQTLQTSTIANNALHSVTKTVSLSKTLRDEARWDFRSSITLSEKTSFSVGIPKIVDGSIEISGSTTIELSEGSTQIKEVSHSTTLQLTVPPKHSCKVSMVGYRYKIEVPYSVRLSRTYVNGKSRSPIITGTYRGVQTGEVTVEVDQCKPLSGPHLS